MAKISLMMASCGLENSATVSSSNIRTSNPIFSCFGDVRTELKIASAADAGEVLLETKSATILAHS
jgi:hypothetical protein